MTDVKSHAMYHPVHGELPRDVPYQAFLVRLVVDDTLELHAIDAKITTAPSGECRQAEKAYAGLIGKRIDRGVMREARALVGGASGCTNLTELFGIAAVTAIQTVGGASLGERDGGLAALSRIADTCYALREDGEILRAVRRRQVSGR